LARNAIITLTSDFGLNDHFIGAMKGVILEIAPSADRRHQPCGAAVRHSGRRTDHFAGLLLLPAGTVHMVIVDPGGTTRRPVLMVGERHMFVAPDNGVLSLIYDREERISVRHVTASIIFCSPQQHVSRARYLLAGRAYLAKGVEPIASATRSPTMSALARHGPSRWTSARCEEWC